jgi:hypothetical protein
MENYQCQIMINNRARDHLKLLKTEIPWGQFREGPVPDLPPMTETKAFVATGSIGPAGTEGTVTYQIGDDANTTVSVYFDIPTRPLSSNTVHADIAVCSGPPLYENVAEGNGGPAVPTRRTTELERGKDAENASDRDHRRGSGTVRHCKGSKVHTAN